MTQRLILISGGIGSGKSAVRDALAARGVRVIDADAVGHAVLEPDGPAFAAVASRWPEVVVDERIDRQALGRIVFGDAAQLADLESITHPLIKVEIALMVDRFGDVPIGVEFPLPLNPFGDRWTRVIVDASDEIRTARLLDRGMSAPDVAARMSAQPSREEWLEMADVVIDNSGDVEALEHEVDRIVLLLRNGPGD